MEQTNATGKKEGADVVAAPAAEKVETPVQEAPAAEKAETPVQAAPAAEKPETPVQEAPAVSGKKVEKNLYLQYNNLEFSDRLMFEAAINDYCQRTGVSEADVEVVNLYVKPEEGKAYYVMDQDGEKTGFIDL